MHKSSLTLPRFTMIKLICIAQTAPARTLSRLSFTAASGSPTRENCGSPREGGGFRCAAFYRLDP